MCARWFSVSLSVSTRLLIAVCILTVLLISVVVCRVPCKLNSWQFSVEDNGCSSSVLCPSIVKNVVRACCVRVVVRGVGVCVLAPWVGVRTVGLVFPFGGVLFSLRGSAVYAQRLREN